MKFSILILNIILFIFGILFSILYLVTFSHVFIIAFYVILIFYFLTLLYVYKELKFVLNIINSNKIKKLSDSPFYVFTDFSHLGKIINNFISKDKMIGAINLTLTKSVTNENFFKVVVENFAIIFNTMNVAVVVYDPVIEKMVFKYGNGHLKKINLTDNFNLIQNKISNIISKDEFVNIFKEDFEEIQNIGIYKLNSTLNFNGYIIFGYTNKKIDASLFNDSNTLLLEIQTAFNLHVNNNVLNQKIKDLNLLNKIITLMETNKNIDQLLHIFLTHITANEGLGFNRAIYFEKEESKNYLKGVKSIGPLTFEEAQSKWEAIVSCTIDVFLEKNSESEDEPLEKLVQNSNLFLHNDVLLNDIIDSKTYKIIDISSSGFSNQNRTILQSFNLKKMLMIPLHSYDNFLGILIVDNEFDNKSFSYDRINSLTSFSNQTSLAINNILLYEKISKLAIVDELTQLYNRRFFNETLENEVSRSLRYEKNCSLIMIDIDFFKNYNDQNGHLVGDELLRLISKIFKSSCRHNDHVCRYGGEEFAIILPDTTSKGALEVAEKIRKKVLENVFPYEEKQPLKKVTISLGISSIPELSDSSFSIKDTADKALYAAKYAGKNRSLIFDPIIHAEIK